MLTKHLQGQKPCCTRQYICSNESSLVVLKVETDSAKHGKCSTERELKSGFLKMLPTLYT